MHPLPARPAIGVDSPLARLSACHARIARRCTGLRRLSAQLSARAADARARTVAAGLLHFFDSAVANHHADEEQHLFPALIESMAGSDAVCLRELVAGLTADHRQLEALWRRVRPGLARIATAESSALACACVEALANACERHIEREERELLPMAARLIDEGELARMGRAMHARRVIDGIA